ncbi:hypothetical protein AB0K16_44850 [Nonomuraea jabiensis]|uniref:hypothetical protein n=1 Tax=Nonomuraea jabiensis TaxID=882448 RepID=UPI003436A8E5
MADNNNDRAASLPATPNPALKTLDRLVGTWQITGSAFTGRTTFAWMEGGFFFIQRSTAQHNGVPITAVEYIGFDEDAQTLRSHAMDNRGSNFAYTWELDGDTLTVWFGDKGSDTYLKTTFSGDGDTATGGWRWPTGDGGTGGYEATMTRIHG